LGKARDVEDQDYVTGPKSTEFGKKK